MYCFSQYKKYRAFEVWAISGYNPMKTKAPTTRLRQARENAGYSSAEAFGKAHENDGINVSTYRSHENGTRKLTPRAAKIYAALLSVDHLWLLGEKTADSPDGNFIYINMYDVTASAGAGRLVPQETVLYAVGFRSEWIKNITGAATRDLGIIKVEGDSMEPTISDGDIVLFDKTQNSPKLQGIYVIRIEDSICVKRVHYDPQRRTVTLISDNKAYPAVEISDLDSFNIIGRILWSAGRI